MIKNFLIAGLALSLFLGGKPPGDIFFSRHDKALNKITPKEFDILFAKGSTIHIYIYSTKKFNTDNLFIMLIKLDNKGVLLPKTEISRSLQIDTDPDSNAVKANIVVYKGGQYYVRVFNPDKPKKPIAESELLID